MVKRILFFLLFLSQIIHAQSWQQVDSFPLLARDNGVSFVIGNKAYCLTGMQINATCSRDGAVYDGGTETWSAISSMPPGTEREYVTAFSHNGFGYLFGALDCSSTCYTDLWRYDTLNDSWQMMNPIPAAGRMGCSCFVLNGKAYICGGRTTGLVILNEVWEYDIANNSWTQKNNLPFPGVWRGNGFSIDTTGYLCYGIMNTLSFPHAIYQYNRQADSWSVVSNLYLPGRTYAECAVVGQQACLYGGVDSAGGAPKNDLLVFDPLSQTLAIRAGIPSFSRRSGMAFSVNNSFYLTTGIDSGLTRVKETWKATNINRIIERNTPEISIYPNPVSDVLHVEMRGINYNVEISNMLGERMMYVNEEKTNVSEFPNGVYFVKGQGDKYLFTRKFVVKH